MAREVGLQELLNAAGDETINSMYTAIPCIVVAVREDLTGLMVDIQPTVNQRMKDGTVKERTVILGVPVSFPVSEKSGLTFPINAGSTTGVAIFSMRSLETWKSGNGRPITPNNFAKFDKSDAMFFPGLMPPGQSVNNPAKHVWTHNTRDTVIFHNLGESTETEIRLLESGGIIINTNQDIEANCENLIANVNSEASINASVAINLTAPSMTVDVQNTTWIGNINQSGNYIQTGNYTLIGLGTFNGIPFDTHRHIGVTTGLGTSGGPTA